MIYTVLHLVFITQYIRDSLLAVDEELTFYHAGLIFICEVQFIYQGLY